VFFTIHVITGLVPVISLLESAAPFLLGWPAQGRP